MSKNDTFEEKQLAKLDEIRAAVSEIRDVIDRLIEVIEEHWL